MCVYSILVYRYISRYVYKLQLLVCTFSYLLIKEVVI